MKPPSPSFEGIIQVLSKSMCGVKVGCDFRFKSFVLGAALAMALPGPISASTYFVGTNGVDSNPGSEASPWLTFQKGLNTVAPGDTLIITPGYYYATNFTKIEGTAENPITIAGQQGAWISWTNGRSLDANGQILGFAVSNSYYHIYGLSLYSNYMALEGTASHCILESNWLEAPGRSLLEAVPCLTPTARITILFVTMCSRTRPSV